MTNLAMRDAVSGAVYWTINGTLHRALYKAIAPRQGGQVVYRDMGRVIEWAVHSAVLLSLHQAPTHPGLGLYLHAVVQ